MVEAKDLGESGTCSAPPQKDIYLHTTSRFLDTRQKHAKKHACSPIRPIENANHVRNILFARLTMKIKKFITRKQKRKAERIKKHLFNSFKVPRRFRKQKKYNIVCGRSNTGQWYYSIAL